MPHATRFGMGPNPVALALLGLAVPPAVGPGPGEVHARSTMCSLAPVGTSLRVPGVVAFLGTASGDTAFAGPGAVKPADDEGHHGPGTPRPIYGLAVRVERLARESPDAVRQAIAGDRSVVLVPWDYSPSCQRVVWTRSARWLPPGARGVFIAALRDRGHWVGSRPTFDVTPGAALYPSPWPTMGRTLDGPALSADEYLALYDVLPDFRSFDARPDSAAAPLLRWAQRFPDLAAKQPAAYLIQYVRRRAAEKAYGSAESPLAGTYRIVLRTNPEDSLVLFARTERHPTSVIRPRAPGAPADRRAKPPPIAGHYLLTELGRTMGELPVRRPAMPARQGYFALIDTPVAHTDSGTVFAGSIDVERAAALLAPDSLARRRIEEASRHKNAVQGQAFRAGQTGTPGQFVMMLDGSVRFHMVIHRDSTPVLTVQAERVSREHLQP